MSLPLAISTGDPGGVGPEIALSACAARERDSALLFGDPDWLRRRALARGIDPVRLCDVELAAIPSTVSGTIGLVRTGIRWTPAALAHEASAEGGAAQLQALDAALAAARAGTARALVTAPMSKHAVNLAGHEFIGHTEHLARTFGLADDEVTMMFLGPRLRVGLVTTHLSVAQLPAAITPARVHRTIEHLIDALGRLLPRERMRVVVSGLNPHAGEAGMFGDEELRTIAPEVEAARARHAQEGLQLEGPMGAETAFRLASTGAIDGVVAMAHDQATIASKLLDWTAAVNVTWGLPIVRTSVDHGVAYDAAAAGKADARGMQSAIEMACALTPGYALTSG